MEASIQALVDSHEKNNGNHHIVGDKSERTLADTTPNSDGSSSDDNSKMSVTQMPWTTRYRIEILRWDNYKRLIGELIGTASLMFFVCGVSMPTNSNVTLMDHAIAAALGIMVIIFAFGPISGAHVNPAVTFGFACVNKFPWMKVPFYITGQICGAVLGTAIAGFLYKSNAVVVLSIPYEGVLVSFFTEILIAVLFMFLACSVASNAQVTGLFAAVAVAASIAVNILVAGPISGASMNPARSVAPAILTGYFKNLWLYLVAPMVGAGIGAGTHHLLTRY